MSQIITQERKSRWEMHLETITALDALSVVGLVMAVIYPIIGLPLSIFARRRLQQAGRDSYVAKVGVQISVFLLILLGLFVIGGFVTSVILPSLTN